MRLSTAFTLSALLGCTMAIPSVKRWNWSNNIEFSAKYFEQPTSSDELAELVKKYRKSHIKVVGTAHSFNDIADTDGIQVNLAKFTDITVDKEAETVTFGAGITYS